MVFLLSNGTDTNQIDWNYKLMRSVPFSLTFINTQGKFQQRCKSISLRKAFTLLIASQGTTIWQFENDMVFDSVHVIWMSFHIFLVWYVNSKLFCNCNHKIPEHFLSIFLTP